MTTSVDVQGMQLAQQDFQLALDQMNSVYSAMTEEQDNLSASWSGMAASAFGQALSAWLDDLYQIRQELVVMTESLSAHTGIYSDANETSQQVVAAFQQGLGGLEELPTEPMVAMRRLRGRLIQPEHALEEPRLLPEGQELPLLPEDFQQGERKRVFMKSVHGVEANVQPAETRMLLNRGMVVHDQPVQPAETRMLLNRGMVVHDQPVRPALPNVPAEPAFSALEPALPALPAQPALPLLPLLPATPDLPAEPTFTAFGAVLPELPVERELPREDNQAPESS